MSRQDAAKSASYRAGIGPVNIRASALCAIIPSICERILNATLNVSCGSAGAKQRRRTRSAWGRAISATCCAAAETSRTRCSASWAYVGLSCAAGGNVHDLLVAFAGGMAAGYVAATWVHDFKKDWASIRLRRARRRVSHVARR